MPRRRVLVHRYKNEPDILAVEINGCSDVPSASSNVDFELVAVIPTLEARTEIAVLAAATSHQYKIREGKQIHWPGSPDVRYRFRVDVANVRFTKFSRIKK